MEGIRIVCPYASYNDCCIVHSTGACADPELVSGGGWSCMMFLHPVPTCADVSPNLCTLCLWWLSLTATYDGGVSPSSVGTKTPLAPAMVSPITTCSCAVFIFTHWHRYWIYTRATYIHCVVVVSGSGGGRCMCMWPWWLYIRGGGGG